MPIEFTPCLLLILGSVYFTGTGGLPECELEANVFLCGVSSFVFSILLFSPSPVMGWDARPQLAQLLLLSCIFIFVFELKIKMFLENHPTSVQCRVKPFSRMSLSMGFWWDCHLADLWRKLQVRSAPCKQRGNCHRERNVWAAKLFGLWKVGWPLGTRYTVCMTFKSQGSHLPNTSL